MEITAFTPYHSLPALEPMMNQRNSAAYSHDCAAITLHDSKIKHDEEEEVNNKQIAITTMAMQLSIPAFAQSLTIFGHLDVPVEYLSNTAPSGGGITRIPNLAGTTPSYVGFRGKEDLGGGISSIFMLEMGFSPDSGNLNQGGRAFGRQAWVGLESDAGTLTLGRNYTMLSQGMIGNFIPGSIHGTASLDSYIPNARSDNSIAYRGKFGKFRTGATYSFGRDTVNAGPAPSGTNCAGETSADSQACRGWSAMVRYDDTSWGVGAAIDEIRGGPGAFAGLTSSQMTDQRLAFSGYVVLDKFKIGGLLLRRDNEASARTPRSNIWQLGLNYAATPSLSLDLQWNRYDLQSSPNDANLWVGRAIYSLSKRTAIYASLAHVRNKGAANFSASSGQAGGNPAPGDSQTALAMGIRHSF